MFHHAVGHCLQFFPPHQQVHFTMETVELFLCQVVDELAIVFKFEGLDTEEAETLEIGSQVVAT